MPISVESEKKQENFRKTSVSASLTMYAKAFDHVDHNKLWKILRDGNTRPSSCLLRNLYACQEETELDMEQRTGSKLRKEYIKAVYGHPACLTSMQSTSC